jgi:hypothetical protein
VARVVVACNMVVSTAAHAVGTPVVVDTLRIGTGTHRSRPLRQPRRSPVGLAHSQLLGVD